MPNATYKYGARTFQNGTAGNLVSTTSASVFIDAWQYMPSAGDNGTLDKHQEQLIAGALIFGATLATAASTAAAGSLQLQAIQYNSVGSTVNSAVIFNQSVSSAAAFTPIDTTSLHNWKLNTGDIIVLLASANTTGIPALSGLVWSATVGG